MAVDKRILFGSLAAAVVISIGGGYALSASGDSEPSSVDDDITITSSGMYMEPGIGVNKNVEGTPLPEVDIRDLDGNTVSTTDLIGQPLVINVWATTCEACKTEMPALAKVNDEFGDQVRFVGINQFRNTWVALDFARDKGVHYELLSDENGDFVASLGITGLPYTLFVAADGTIVSQSGIGLDEGTIRATIADTLLGT